LVGKPGLLGDLDVNGKIILDGSQRNRLGSCGLDLFGTRQGPVVSSCEHDNEPSGFIKVEEFLD
jgi:hypothetical protein